MLAGLVPLAVLILAGPALAGGEAYVEKMKATVGGPAWDAVKTLSAEGTVTAAGLSGKYQVTEDLGSGRFTERDQFEPFTEAEGINSAGRWRQDGSGQVHALNSREAMTVALTEAYLTERGYFFPAKFHAYVHPQPSASEDGKRFDLIEITPKDGRILTLWVDGRTRLIDHVTYQLSTAMKTIRFHDYRKVGALMLPFEIVTDEGDPENAETIKISGWQIDAPNAEAELARPSNKVTDAHIAGDAASATVPLALDAGSLLIEAKINGQGPFPFILDTGGHDILTPAAAEQLGLKPIGHGISRGAGEGTTGIQYTRVAKVEIGDAEIDDQPFVVLPFEYFVTERGKAPPIAGLIGLELFERFAVKLDYGQHQMTLAPLDSFEYRDHGSALPIRFTDDMPLVAARLDGHPGSFGIDTGNGGDVVVFGNWAGPIGVAQQFKSGLPLISFGVGGQSTAYAARGATLDLGGPLVKDFIARLAEDKAGAFSSRSEAGNIGKSILSRFAVTFDYRHEIMALEPLANPEIQPFGRIGLGASKDKPDSYIVRIVYKDSPAAAAGLAAGDRIIAIDGVAASELSGADLYKKGRQPVGTVLTLTIEHEGQPKDVSLSLKEVLP